MKFRFPRAPRLLLRRLPLPLRLLPLLLPASGCAPETPFTALPKTEVKPIQEYVEKSIAFGARHSGSDAIAAYAAWIRDAAAKNRKAAVTVHSFTASTPGGQCLFRNIIAEIPGASRAWILVGCHYDAKHFLSLSGFQAANDGASGVAALLAMIGALEKYPDRPPCAIRFVFFDGEECLYEYGEHDGLHGSRALAAKWAQSGELRNCRAMFLLDMVGDRELNLTIPANSSPALIRQFERIVREAAPNLAWTKLAHGILDDHVPFLTRGVPALDLIDFDYGPGNSYWHTAGDAIDKVSAQSIKTVADLTFALIWHAARP